MRAQSDATESNQGDQQRSATNCKPPPVAPLHRGKNKKSELPVKQGRPDGVTTGKLYPDQSTKGPSRNGRCRWTRSFTHSLRNMPPGTATTSVTSEGQYFF